MVEFLSQTEAVSERQAENFVRYRVFGKQSRRCLLEKKGISLEARERY
ncbi:MAG: hypothetical protein WCX70_00020 [Candidatus Paceibacterota bacterium]